MARAAAKERTLEVVEAELMKVNQERKALTKRGIELTAERDKLYFAAQAKERVESMSDAEKAALAQQLGLGGVK